MRFIASKRLGPREANEIWEALIEGIRRTSELRRIMSSASFEQVNLSRLLSSAWNALRRSTLKAASPIRLLSGVAGIGKEPSIIESIVPRLFSAPVPLLLDLSRKHLPSLHLEYDQTTFHERAVIAPVSKALLLDFFRILLENMSKYGQAGSHKGICQLEGDPRELLLSIRLVDSIRADSESGQGTGIPLLREIARTGRFEFVIENNTDFVVNVRFHNVMQLSPFLDRVLV